MFLSNSISNLKECVRVSKACKVGRVVSRKSIGIHHTLAGNSVDSYSLIIHNSVDIIQLEN